MWDVQGGVDRAGAIVAGYLRGGGSRAAAIAALGRALLHEDAGFHWYQVYEAGVRQSLAWPAGFGRVGPRPRRRGPVPRRPHADPSGAADRGPHRHPPAARRPALRGGLTTRPATLVRWQPTDSLARTLGVEPAFDATSPTRSAWPRDVADERRARPGRRSGSASRASVLPTFAQLASPGRRPGGDHRGARRASTGWPPTPATCSGSTGTTPWQGDRPGRLRVARARRAALVAHRRREPDRSSCSATASR